MSWDWPSSPGNQKNKTPTKLITTPPKASEIYNHPSVTSCGTTSLGMAERIIWAGGRGGRGIRDDGGPKGKSGSEGEWSWSSQVCMVVSTSKEVGSAESHTPPLMPIPSDFVSQEDVISSHPIRVGC